MTQAIQWLLSSESYVQYRTRLDLMEQSPDDPEVIKARSAMLKQPQVQSLVSELQKWPGDAIANHKKANLLYHKLAFLAEIGLTMQDLGIGEVIEKILARISEQGILEAQVNFPKVFGGTGEDMWAWVLCDTPRLYFSLLQMGIPFKKLQAGIESLAALVKDNGYPCAASPKLGHFKGPGKRSDPCPYATLLMLSALLQTENKFRPELHIGAESLLSLWEHSREHYPFLFHMGTDFRKLKAPFIWYDLLHVADVLSQMEWLRGDARMQNIIDSIKAKADANGLYTPESVWMAWKGWDFAQKKQPSPWLTFLVLRILKRFGE